MKNFTYGMKIVFNLQKTYYIIRNLVNYFDEKGIFDFQNFYQSNYAIFENNFENEKIIFCKNEYEYFFVNYSNFHNDIRQLEFSNKKPLSNIFFIQGGNYGLYDEKFNLIKNFSFSCRIGKLGIYNLDLDTNLKIDLIIFPSKSININDIVEILNTVNGYFPNSICGDNSLFEKIEKNINIKEITELIPLIKPIKKIEKIEKNIFKCDFNYSEYEITDNLENLILSKGGFDKIRNNEELPVFKKFSTYNNVENNYLLGLLKNIKNKFNINIFDDIIAKFTNLGIIPTLDNNIPIILMQNPIFEILYTFYNKSELQENNYIYNLDLKNISTFKIDNINSINNIYEIYCFIEFQHILKEIGFNFIDDVNIIYDIKKNEIIKYEKDFKKGYLKGYFGSKKFTYYFGDKICPANLRKYSLMTEFGFDFLSDKYKRVSINGLTPDITLEFDDKIYFCDVKFSSFKDYNTKLYFPNPEYIFFELQKYRKILINGDINSNPIIVFYPGLITEIDFDKYKLFHKMILNCYNMFLLPIYPGNKKNIQFNKYILNNLKIIL